MSKPEFDNVPLECIRPSPTNPRKHFDPAQLQELAESIRQHGVAQPIVVRRVPTVDGSPVHFELVAGERRYRASGLAGYVTVPAIIRELTDQEALEIQVIENLQRADLHPLEEAEGYEKLMHGPGPGVPGFTVEQLADKVGKSKAYIYTRLKLCALGEAARTAFYDGKLTSTTALLVARIPAAKLQEHALKAIVEPQYSREPLSARDATRLIHEKFMLRLKDAPFKTTDEKLLPRAGTCTACPKRTGNQPELFTDVDSVDVCTDPDCFAQKKAAWAVIKIAEAKAKERKVIQGKEAKRIFPYDHSSYPNAGYKQPGDRCYSDAKKRSWKQLAKEAGIEPVLVLHPSGELVELVREDDLKPHYKALGMVSRKGTNPDNASANAEVAKAKAESAFRRALFDEIRTAAAGKIDREDLNDIALRMLARVESNDFKRLMVMYQWPKDLNAYSDHDGRLRKLVSSLLVTQVNDLLRDCTLIGESHAGVYSSGKPERLLAAAARYGVDVKKIKASLAVKTPAKKPRKVLEAA